MGNAALIIGASSGIGEQLARTLAEDGYEVGMTARRLERLEEIGEELPTRSYCARMDVTQVDSARSTLGRIWGEMDAADVVVLNAGVGPGDPDLSWEPARKTIETNVAGFVALATAAIDRFDQQGHGHLVGISSVAAHVGIKEVPTYSASKAFVSNYLQALRFRSQYEGRPITVTTIEPGYVDTDLSHGGFWLVSPETAAAQIARAIRKEKRHAYVPRRWRLVAGLLDLLPEPVVRRMV